VARTPRTAGASYVQRIRCQGYGAEAATRQADERLSQAALQDGLSKARCSEAGPPCASCAEHNRIVKRNDTDSFYASNRSRRRHSPTA